MQNFDKQWQTVAGRARQAPGRDETAPFGFARRAVALSWQAPALGPEVLWVRLTLRVLAGAMGVLIVCAALEWPHLRDSRPLEPGVENTVAQIVWAL
jgi:hypothetical protein